MSGCSCSIHPDKTLQSDNMIAAERSVIVVRIMHRADYHHAEIQVIGKDGFEHFRYRQHKARFVKSELLQLNNPTIEQPSLDTNQRQEH